MTTACIALLALVLSTASFALAPGASASAPCIEGEPDCLVYVEMRVCVTEPCDWLTVCAGFGLVCADL